MEATQADPIIAELRAIRKAYAARFNYDVDVRLTPRRTTGDRSPETSTGMEGNQ